MMKVNNLAYLSENGLQMIFYIHIHKIDKNNDKNRIFISEILFSSTIFASDLR